jgi:hypothetical protein
MPQTGRRSDGMRTKDRLPPERSLAGSRSPADWKQPLRMMIAVPRRQRQQQSAQTRKHLRGNKRCGADARLRSCNVASCSFRTGTGAASAKDNRRCQCRHRGRRLRKARRLPGLPHRCRCRCRRCQAKLQCNEVRIGPSVIIKVCHPSSNAEPPSHHRWLCSKSTMSRSACLRRARPSTSRGSRSPPRRRASDLLARHLRHREALRLQGPPLCLTCARCPQMWGGHPAHHM